MNKTNRIAIMFFAISVFGYVQPMKNIAKDVYKSICNPELYIHLIDTFKESEKVEILLINNSGLHVNVPCVSTKEVEKKYFEKKNCGRYSGNYVLDPKKMLTQKLTDVVKEKALNNLIKILSKIKFQELEKKIESKFTTRLEKNKFLVEAIKNRFELLEDLFLNEGEGGAGRFKRFIDYVVENRTHILDFLKYASQSSIIKTSKHNGNNKNYGVVRFYKGFHDPVISVKLKKKVIKIKLLKHLVDNPEVLVVKIKKKDDKSSGLLKKIKKNFSNNSYTIEICNGKQDDVVLLNRLKEVDKITDLKKRAEQARKKYREAMLNLMESEQVIEGAREVFKDVEFQNDQKGYELSFGGNIFGSIDKARKHMVSHEMCLTKHLQDINIDNIRAVKYELLKEEYEKLMKQEYVLNSQILDLETTLKADIVEGEKDFDIIKKEYVIENLRYRLVGLKEKVLCQLHDKIAEIEKRFDMIGQSAPKEMSFWLKPADEEYKAIVEELKECEEILRPQFEQEYRQFEQECILMQNLQGLNDENDDSEMAHMIRTYIIDNEHFNCNGEEDSEHEEEEQ